MNYGELNLIFLAVAFAATWVIKSRYRCFTTPVVAIPMLIITALFDNLIILAGIVEYDTSKIYGVYVGVAPVEDFAYTVVAVLLVPAIWKALAK